METTADRLRKLKIEKVKRLQLDVWRRCPMVWLRDRFGEDPADYQWSLRPGYEDHKWDGDRDPLSSAWNALAQDHWVGIEAATGTSKTFLLSRVVFWFLDVYENSLVVTTAPKQDQLKLHLWAEVNNAFHKFKRLRPKAEMLSLRLKANGFRGDTADEDENFADSWQAVGFVSGSGTEEQSATRAQGFHRENMLLISEETAGMHHAIMTAFKNTCTGTRNMILAVGNPDSELDTLHQFCLLSHVRKFRISAYDYPNVVQKAEIIKGAVTIGSIERRVSEYGRHSQLFLSRVRGISPEQSIDSLIKVGWIKNCINKDVPLHGYNAVGVDVSNSEAGDKAALAWGESSKLIKVHEFQCSNATHLAYNLMFNEWELADKGYTNYHTWRLEDLGIGAEQVGVDSVGVGVATVNAFIDMSMIVKSLSGGQWDEAIPVDEQAKPLYRFVNLRTQMYWELREDLRQGLVSFCIDDPVMLEQIIKELSAPKVSYDQSAIALESKENIKKRLGGKSPNVGDAIVYWNWVRKGYRVSAMALPISAG